MRKYDRSDIKITFLKEDTMFFVHKQKGTVVCIVKGYLNIPWCCDSPFYFANLNVSGKGVAKCHQDDLFDEERGKRIALAKAENACYVEAMNNLRKFEEHFDFMLNCIDNFIDKGVRQCKHNIEYIERTSNPEHPEYKKELTKITHGYTNGISNKNN